MSRIILNEKGIPIGAVRSYPEEDIYKVRDDFEAAMGMTITVKVEYEGKTPKEDLGIQEKFSLEAIRDAKIDLVALAIYRMVDMINKAREEAHAVNNR